MAKNSSSNLVMRDTVRDSIAKVMDNVAKFHGSKLLPAEKAKQMRKGDTQVELVLVAGPPGPGKTQVGMKTLEQIARNHGLNPVRYTPGVRPTGPNDCLIGYRSAAEMMRMDLIGIPNLYEIEEKALDDDFKPIVLTNLDEMDEKQREAHKRGEVVYKTIKREAADYRYPDFWATVKAFPYAGLMLDEINRSMCQSQFLALLNGDDVEGLKLPKSLVIGTLNEGASDGNDVEAMSTALRTRAAIYYTKPDVNAWINGYALEAGIHPCAIAFAKLYSNVFESFKVPADDMVAAPTLRGITRLSDALVTYELMNPNLSGDNIDEQQLRQLVFARLGEHLEVPDLPTSFSKLYKVAYKTVIPQVRLVMQNSDEFKTGMTDDFEEIIRNVCDSKARSNLTQAQAAENRGKALMYTEYLVREFVTTFERDFPQLVTRHIQVSVLKNRPAPKQGEKLTLTVDEERQALQHLRKMAEDGSLYQPNANFVEVIAFTLMRRFVRGLTPMDATNIRVALASLKALDGSIDWSDERHAVVRMGLAKNDPNPKSLIWGAFISAFRSYEPNVQIKRWQEQAAKSNKVITPEETQKLSKHYQTIMDIFKEGQEQADLSFVR